MERPVNEHRVPSNRETLSWFKDNLKNGKASKDMFKTEALSFFNLSPEMGAKDKRSFKRKIEHFADMHQSLLRKWLREFLAENGGLGKNHDNPPSDFGLEIENDRKRAFLKFGRDGVKSWWKYQDWLEEECALFRESVKNSKGKKPVEDKEDHDEESNNQIRLLRERSSGKNIWDAEKITFSKKNVLYLPKVFQRQRGLSNCFYLRWGVLLKGDLPIVFSCSATLTVQAGFP